MTDYDAFLRAKAALARPSGLAAGTAVSVNPLLKDHQRAIVEWAVRGGRRAIFAAFGLGKTFMQIETLRCALAAGGRGLIVAPLGVRQEFMRDVATLATGDHERITDAQRAELAAWQARGEGRVPALRFVRSPGEVEGDGLYLTNYETVRDGRLDPRLFDAASLDEASCLRGFGGSKTFREFMALFAGDDRKAGTKTGGVRYRFVATATPSPNDYIELLAYAAYLGVMDVGEAKTRFFKRNSEAADRLTLHPHKEEEFWLWVSSWAVFVQKPSDLGFDDSGYELPPVTVRWHELPSDLSTDATERNGQGILIRETSASVVEAAREKRASLEARVARAAAIAAASPGDHFIFWHDLEAERRALEAAIPGLATVYGAQDLEDREALIAGFSDGRIARLGGKPVMLGSGCNFQRHCHRAVYVGITAKFNDLIQSFHRLVRFLQARPVEIDIVYTEAERGTRKILEEKWRAHERQVAIMGEIIRKYGLNEQALARALERSIGVERVEVRGRQFRIVNNDTVVETTAMAENSVGLIVTSIPFSTQYEYTPSYNDFGHTEDDRHFWEQMGFLIPQLRRVLMPGRWAAVHVKDRIVPGGINGLGFQTLSTFHCDAIAEFRRHGFAYMGMKTITTDVVRENNQTYRLGWTEQCKDATKMGVGTPEYLLLFRKPQSDRSKSYADTPVVKAKKEWVREFAPGVDPDLELQDPARHAALGHPSPERKPTTGAWRNPDGYSRGRWQIDAHAYARSSGDRAIRPEEWTGLPSDQVYKLWKAFNLETVYDFEQHVALAEGLETRGRLPPTFMLLPPHSPHPDVWTDVARMLTLNGSQHARGREMHLCPLQFDIVDRAVLQLSNSGDTVFDPFGGLMTVPARAVRHGRFGLGVELNAGYFLDGAAHCRAAEERLAMPGLFDLLEVVENAD